jgi:hypothetical protein
VYKFKHIKLQKIRYYPTQNSHWKQFTVTISKALKAGANQEKQWLSYLRNVQTANKQMRPESQCQSLKFTAPSKYLSSKFFQNPFY